MKKDEEQPAINESVMKACACTASQDASITLSNRRGIYPSNSAIAMSGNIIS
jgi:hypothetical protein